MPDKIKNSEKLIKNELFTYVFYRILYNGLKYVSFVVYNNCEFQKFMIAFLNDKFNFEYIKIYNKMSIADMNNNYNNYTEKSEIEEEFTYTCGRYYLCFLFEKN